MEKFPLCEALSVGFTETTKNERKNNEPELKRSEKKFNFTRHQRDFSVFIEGKLKGIFVFRALFYIIKRNKENAQ
jgi:hypothetical protein